MSDEHESATPLRSVTFKLSTDDIGRLRAIAQRRYPGDRNVLTRTLRDLLREEYARQKRLAERERSGK